MGRDYSAILDVPRDADSAILKKAYRTLATRWHPDKTSDNVSIAQSKFQQISEAYDVLSDRDKRTIYDQFGEEGLKAGVGGHIRYTFSLTQAINLFSQLFDCDFPDSFSSFPDVLSARPQKLDPCVIELRCTLEELFTGCTKKMKIIRTINGSENSKIIQIEVQPGWKNGTKITFDGAGDCNGNEVAQDVVFVIQEREHEIWKRKGDDLLTKEVISLKKALCGFKCTRMGIDGVPIILEVADVLEPNQERRIRGKGMPKHGGGRGDVIFQIDIIFPSQLSVEQKAIIGATLPD
jgi:DnaJ-class molecular chaperone